LLLPSRSASELDCSNRATAASARTRIADHKASPQLLANSLRQEEFRGDPSAPGSETGVNKMRRSKSAQGPAEKSIAATGVREHSAPVQETERSRCQRSSGRPVRRSTRATIPPKQSPARAAISPPPVSIFPSAVIILERSCRPLELVLASGRPDTFSSNPSSRKPSQDVSETTPAASNLGDSRE